jgi:hypothetical protein
MYKPGSDRIPRFVRSSFLQGYQITHVGMLCWSNTLPPAGLVPRARALFLLIEAYFTVIFHACKILKTDELLTTNGMLPWSRKSVPWNPLCSHLSLIENIWGDLELTEEQLEIADAIRKRNGNTKCQRHRKKKRAEDLDAYRKNVTRQKKDWSRRNTKKVLKIARKVRNKAKNAARFHCHACNVNLATQAALKSHYKTKTHRDALAGKPPSGPSTTKNAVAILAVRHAAKEAGLHKCRPCGKDFGTDNGLQRHINESKKHAKIVAAAGGISATTS